MALDFQKNITKRRAKFQFQIQIFRISVWKGWTCPWLLFFLAKWAGAFVNVRTNALFGWYIINSRMINQLNFPRCLNWKFKHFLLFRRLNFWGWNPKVVKKSDKSHRFKKLIRRHSYLGLQIDLVDQIKKNIISLM